LLAFLNRSVEHAAAVIAGLGFGTFIGRPRGLA
jgi:hypothetical protein